MRRWIWLLTILTIALFAIVSWFTPKHEQSTLYGYSDPTIALQMAHNWAQLATILSLEPAERARFTTQTRLDFGLLAAYGSLFALMILDAYRGRKRAWALMLLPLAAASCDALENVWTLAVLQRDGGFENYMALTIRQWALLKTFFLGAAFLAIGFGQPRVGRQLILAVLYCVAGSLAWWGCIDNPRILYGFLPLGAAFSLQLVLYRSDAASFKTRATASGS